MPAESTWPGLATNVLSFVDLQRGNTVAAAERLEAFLASPEMVLLDLPEQVTFYAMVGESAPATAISGWRASTRSARWRSRAGRAIRRRSAALCTRTRSRSDSPIRIAASRELEQSIELTRAGASPVVFGYSSGTLAMMRAERGERDIALRTLREAFSFAAGLGDRPQLVYLSASAVQTLSPLGIFEPVAMIAGYAMATISDHHDAPGSVLEAFLAALTHARDGLGAEVFDALVSRGMSMSYDEILRYAFSTLDELLADTSS